MGVLRLVADHIGDICQIATFAAIIIKPIREKLFGFGVIVEGLRCLLRQEIVRTYYRHKDEKKLKEYEFKSLVLCHGAYKALKGNSFVDHVYAEMQEWEIF